MKEQPSDSANRPKRPSIFERAHTLASRYVAVRLELKNAGVEFQIPVSGAGSKNPTVEELLKAAESQLTATRATTSTVSAKKHAVPYGAVLVTSPARSAQPASNNRRTEAMSDEVRAMFTQAAAEPDPFKRGLLFRQASVALMSSTKTNRKK